MPVFVMRQTLPQKEFAKWFRYFANKQPDETEIQLATLSLMVSQGLGAKNVKYDDYLVNKPPKVKAVEAKPDEVLDNNEIISVFGGIAVPMK